MDNQIDKEQEILPLDDICIQKIQQADEMVRNAHREANAAINGMLSYYLAINKVEGNWKLAENRRELVLDRVKQA